MTIGLNTLGDFDCHLDAIEVLASLVPGALVGGDHVSVLGPKLVVNVGPAQVAVTVQDETHARTGNVSQFVVTFVSCDPELDHLERTMGRFSWLQDTATFVNAAVSAIRSECK